MFGDLFPKADPLSDFAALYAVALFFAGSLMRVGLRRLFEDRKGINMQKHSGDSCIVNAGRTVTYYIVASALHF